MDKDKYGTALPHICPHCGKEANTGAEIEILFGYRNNNGYIMAQSWCKECRSKDS